MEFMDAVRARRSIRRFAPKPVPEDALADILEAGRLAPSSGGVNSGYFGVIRDESTKRALTALAGDQEWIATAPVIIALCSRLSPDAATRAPDDQFTAINTARFGAELLTYLNAYPHRTAMRVYADNAFPLLPGEHLALAAASHGLSSCWIGHLDTRRASELLGLPEDVVCLYLLPIGYADETPADRRLRPIDECVFHDRWPPDTTLDGARGPRA
ncbi:MAG: hypothetical protein HKP61_04700 [Dactylosporangium sp.]|nr:nitroreductase family protein [Dactylosporangium sp.]NNJ60246.1 hypothetical protein [Dactylosporangium sp.]